MNKLIKNTFLYSISNILPQAVAFILLPLYTEYLLPEEYGIVNAMVVVQGILAVFFSLSIERAIIRMYWDYTDNEKMFLGTLSISITILSFFVLVCSFLIRDILHTMFKEIDFYPFYVFTIILTFSLTFSLVPKNYYRLKNKAKEYFLLSFAELILNTLLIIVFLVHLKEGALGIIKAKMFVSLLMLPLYIGILIKHIEFRFDLGILKNSLKFSLPMIPTLFAAWILGQADRIFIADNLSLHDVGIYSLSRRVAGLIGIIAGAFTMAYHPLFFEMVNSSKSNLIKLIKINNAFILVLIFFSFILAFFSKEFILLFLNEKYFISYLYIPPIILTGLIGSISSTLLGAFFQQSKKMKESMFFGLLGAGITLSLYYILVSEIGVWGAIIGNLTATILIFTLLYNFAKKRCFFLPFDWGKIIVFASVTIIIVIIFNNYLALNLYFSLIIKLVVSLIIFTVLLKMNSKELLLLIRKKN